MYRLHAITGEFHDRRTERAFRASILPEVQRASRLTLIVAALLTVLFVISDYSFFGFAWPFYPPLLAMRLATIAIYLGLAFFLFRSDALLDRAWVYSIPAATVATGVFMVAALRPHTLPTQVTAVGIVIMAIYLFVPNVMRGMLASCAYLSLGFLLSAWYFVDADGTVLLRIAILLVLANVVGYFAARRVARLQRQQFAMLMEERRSKERLVSEVERREALERQLRDLAQTDGLTGLSNRRHFIEIAEAALATARARGEAFSLAMIDVDNFKQINDSFGHGIGDAVLKRVADACVRVFGTDVPIGRFGGEEFVVALPGRDLGAARAAADRLRRDVAALRVADGPEALRVTVTAGVTAVQPDEAKLSAGLARADAALYDGKRRGRNVVLADGD
jgi:diguanylate cyclase (GGDEF)-like protein